VEQALRAGVHARLAQVIRMVGESQETVSVGGGSGSSSNKMPTLEEYGTNLTAQATEVRARAYCSTCMRSKDFHYFINILKAWAG
jgi:hypothetical protein